MCGEKFVVSFCALCVQGSPPHVRGKDPNGGRDVQKIGITPACAGKSKYVYMNGCEVEDHPRMCGEKSQQMKVRKQVKGSPPHVRGKVVAGLELIKVMGITPACAGKRGCNQQEHP